MFCELIEKYRENPNDEPVEVRHYINLSHIKRIQRHAKGEFYAHDRCLVVFFNYPQDFVVIQDLDGSLYERLVQGVENVASARLVLND